MDLALPQISLTRELMKMMCFHKVTHSSGIHKLHTPKIDGTFQEPTLKLETGPLIVITQLH